jgi:hypothetical protein
MICEVVAEVNISYSNAIQSVGKNDSWNQL